MASQRAVFAEARRWAVRFLPSTVPRTTSRAFVSATSPVLEKRIMKVPTMGDSITEGTIVEWTVGVGQAVKEGEVVALVETDKVTVDLKAEIDGVVTQHFGKIDDTVEVGGDLYEIDTDAKASAAPKETAEKTPEPEKEQAVAVESAPETAAKSSSGSGEFSHRTPSIHFFGKEGWARLKSGETPDSGASTSSPSKQATTTTVTGPIPPMYGRPQFTEEEIEALVMGGATLAPEVVAVSGGAKFK